MQENEVKVNEIEQNEISGSSIPERKVKKHSRFWLGILVGAAVCSTVFLVATVVFVSKYTDAIKIRYAASVAEDTAASDGLAASDSDINQEIMDKVTLLETAVSLYSIYEFDEEALKDGIYQGLVDSLGDPYSDYYSTSELNEFYESASGVYEGIGAYIGYNKEYDYPEFTKIMEGTPAESSGILAGDLIFEVDGTNCYEMETSDVVSLVKGEGGTTVTITVYREAIDDYIDIEVTRAKIETPLIVSKMLENNIGYIEIMQFEDVTYDQFVVAKDELTAEGMESLIIDLRGNPGGNLSTVNQIARQLLPEGVIVYTVDKYGVREDYTCDGNNEIQIPLVVLIDENSASASEILAGAIKDYQKGTLVGETSFGKGIVQRIISLGDDTAIKLTISEYYTPNGINIHGIGIEPDVLVEFDSAAYIEDGTDTQLNKAIEILNGSVSETVSE